MLDGSWGLIRSRVFGFDASGFGALGFGSWACSLGLGAMGSKTCDLGAVALKVWGDRSGNSGWDWVSGLGILSGFPSDSTPFVTLDQCMWEGLAQGAIPREPNIP